MRKRIPHRLDWLCQGLANGDVGGLQTLGAFLDRELNLLALFQGAETRGLDGGVMDEDVRAVGLGEETITLAGIEPLDCADDTIRHCISLLKAFEKVF